jgi:late competence protein required for DNA uptake (superfamily II DNA/RNA helicase)
MTVEENEDKCYRCKETEFQVTELIVEGDKYICDKCLLNR